MAETETFQQCGNCGLSIFQETLLCKMPHGKRAPELREVRKQMWQAALDSRYEGLITNDDFYAILDIIDGNRPTI